MRRTAAFWVACRQMPAGHGHCVHGHVGDCPAPVGCPEVVAEPVAHVVVAGRCCWVFVSERLAAAHVRVLSGQGAEFTFQRGLPALKVDVLLAGLPGYVRVEDMR